MNTPTTDQAIAFFETIVGWNELGAAGDQIATHPKAPEAAAHLRAALPRGMPVNWEVSRIGRGQPSLIDGETDLKRVQDLLEYVKACAQTLRNNISGSDGPSETTLLEQRHEEQKTRIHNALDIARRYGQIGTAHHKARAIDQMVQYLTGIDYHTFVKFVSDYEQREEGEKTYERDTGIAP